MAHKILFLASKSLIFGGFVPFYNKIKMSVDFVNALKGLSKAFFCAFFFGFLFETELDRMAVFGNEERIELVDAVEKQNPGQMIVFVLNDDRKVVLEFQDFPAQGIGLKIKDVRGDRDPFRPVHQTGNVSFDGKTAFAAGHVNRLH